MLSYQTIALPTKPLGLTSDLSTLQQSSDIYPAHSDMHVHYITYITWFHSIVVLLCMTIMTTFSYSYSMSSLSQFSY